MDEDTMKGEALQVLLVEDNEDHVELIVRSMQEHRVANRIHSVKDGEEALDYLFQRGAYAAPSSSPRPHLVLLDLRLPKIDGLEVLRQIKTDPELMVLPVVILTTSKAEADVARAYMYRANSYVVKPLDFHQFSRLMGDLGFYWLGWNYYPWS